MSITWSFAGRTVLVTGASRGIGLASARLFADAGAEVFALARSEQEQAPRLHPIVADVRSAGQLAEAARRAASQTGRIDICVANAGGVVVEDYAQTDPQHWRELIDVNLTGVMRTWQAALPYMGQEGHGGRLIANSSAAGVRGEPLIAAYSASKAAISGLVQALALYCAKRGITVNAVAPGEIDTQLNREGRRGAARRQGRPEQELLHEMLSGAIPLGRLGEPEEIASLIAYLASDEAAYLTGQTLVIDGGQLLV